MIKFCLKCSANFIIVPKAKVICLPAYFVEVKKQVKGYLNNRSGSHEFSYNSACQVRHTKGNWFPYTVSIKNVFMRGHIFDGISHCS